MSRKTDSGRKAKTSLDRVWQVPEAQVASGWIPGYVAAIRVGGRAEVQLGGRMAVEPESAPMGEDTVFRIASLTKVIGGALTLSTVRIDEPGDGARDPSDDRSSEHQQSFVRAVTVPLGSNPSWETTRSETYSPQYAWATSFPIADITAESRCRPRRVRAWTTGKATLWRNGSGRAFVDARPVQTVMSAYAWARSNDAIVAAHASDARG